MPNWRQLATAALLLALLVVGLLLLQGCAPKEIRGNFPEELVHVRSNDGIVNGGVLFAPPTNAARPIAIIWIHGWGVNFYQPTYVNIGRALADRGYPCLAVNTRMHDLGNVAGYRGGKRIRGGGYWGVASEEAQDLAAWIDFAGTRGFGRVVLVGHSAGWAAVRRYQAQRQDPRVLGVVLASGAVRAETRVPDPDQLAQATRMLAEGHGDDLVRDPKRSFPSFVSAATFMDIANTPPEFKDFFGVAFKNPAVTRIQCPLLAFFGTREKEIGTEEDLEILKLNIGRLPRGPCRVDTAMIQGADHMYTGEEPQVAETIAKWSATLLPAAAGKSVAQSSLVTR